MPIETPKYREVLSQSLIGVNVAGAGYDCARFWEILAAGSLLLTQQLDISIPHPFTDGENCVIFKSFDDFDLKLDGLLRCPAELDRIAEAGFQHLVLYHTTSARAEYFLSKVSEAKSCKYCNSYYSDPRKYSVIEKINIMLRGKL